LVRIAISVEAFEAIARTLPFSSVGCENKTNEWGEKLILLDRAVGRPNCARCAAPASRSAM
jgi:hypothetical protein